MLNTSSAQIRMLVKNPTIIKFIIVGFANTLVGLTVIYLCKWFISLDDISSNIIGYCVGLIISFNLNSKWTFRFSGNQWHAFIRFILVFIFSYSANLLTVMTAIETYNMNSYLAQALGVPPYVLLFYLASRFFVFYQE